MWVRITGYSDTGYVGLLNNDPRTVGAPIADGERVEFGPDHVIDVEANGSAGRRSGASLLSFRRMRQ